MAAVMTDGQLLAIGERWPAWQTAVIDALGGDVATEQQLMDFALEKELDRMHPFQVGQKWLICTVTLYYVGEVAEVGFGWIRLKNAAWVHWTGRLSVLLRGQQWKGRAFNNRTPRVEPCGDVVIYTQPIVSAYPWSGPLVAEAVE